MSVCTAAQKILLENQITFGCLLILDLGVQLRAKNIIVEKSPFRQVTKNGLYYQSISKTRFF